MTPEEIAEIEARANAATPGAWSILTHEPSLSRMVVSNDRTLDIDFGYVGNRTEADAEFVAHARTDVPALLAVVERLTARLKAAEDVATVFGWTGVTSNSDRERATATLYGRWIDVVGLNFGGPDAHPDLDIAALAREYDETRARTLAKIRSDAPTELPGGEG